MSAIILPRSYRTQPQQAPQVDWSHPLARGLQAAWVASHPRLVMANPAAGSIPFVTITAAPTANSRGVAAQCLGASGYIQIGPNNVFQANTWTGLLLAQTNGRPGAQGAMFTVATGPSSGTADRSLYVSNQGLSAFLFDGGGNKTATGPSGVIDSTRARVMAAMSDGSSLQAWLDGHQEATTATASGGFSGYGGSAYIVIGFGVGGGGSALDSDARASLFLWWNRALSEAEHKAIAAEPFSVFAQPKRSWLNGVAAPPPAPSGRPYGFIAT